MKLTHTATVASLLAADAAAWVTVRQPWHPGATAGRSRQGAVADETLSWQESLEKAVSPRASLAERQVMFQDLFARREEVLSDVQSAVVKGTPEDLLPADSEIRRATIGARAVRRQVEQDIIPMLVAEAPGAPGKLAEAAPEFLARATEAAQQAMPTTGVDLSKTIPELQKKLPEFVTALADEATNVVSSTPPGLQTPDYTVEDALGGGVEVRQYAEYSVCTVSMDESSSSGDPLLSSGNSFGTLAKYIFGENAEEASISMTTPVAIDYVSNNPSTMSFVLGDGIKAATAPSPTSPRVAVSDCAPTKVAAIEFPGFATAGEVQRQLSILKESMSVAGYEYDEGATYQLLQYNPPYTLPFLRRNELLYPLGSNSVSSTESTSTTTPSESTRTTKPADWYKNKEEVEEFVAKVKADCDAIAQARVTQAPATVADPVVGMSKAEVDAFISEVKAQVDAIAQARVEVPTATAAPEEEKKQKKQNKKGKNKSKSKNTEGDP